MCGWVWRASTYQLTKGQFKRRWMILIDFTLSFYKDSFHLNECKGIINCADIVDIEEEEDDEGNVITLYYGNQTNQDMSSWSLRWDKLSPPYIRTMWKQKLLKCCKHLRKKYY